MDTRTRKVILAAMILALAAMLYVTFTGGELLRREPENANLRADPTSPSGLKPTTDLMDSFRGTATAEAEQATPEPEAKLPGMKAQPQENFGDWWFEIRFPNWVSA